jgi:hypothetical protein
MSRLILGVKILLGAGLTFACAGILGIEDAQCSDQFNGCPGFQGDGDVTGDGDTTDAQVPGDGDTEQDGGAEADSGADEDSGAVESMDPEVLCDEYCTEMMDGCVEDADIQYPSYNFCMNVCANFEIGEPGDDTGNTLFCRLKRSRQLPDEPADLCQAAGPSGGGVCGESLCDNVCDMVMDICFEEFATRAACMTECESLDDLGTYNSTIQNGLERQCRQYHVNAAATDATVHCPHTAGAGPCSTPRN